MIEVAFETKRLLFDSSAENNFILNTKFSSFSEQTERDFLDQLIHQSL